MTVTTFTHSLTHPLIKINLMRVYLDNAATTPLDAEVMKTMCNAMESHFGNPSSIHAHGRESRALLEKARKTVANLLHTSPAEIFYQQRYRG